MHTQECGLALASASLGHCLEHVSNRQHSPEDPSFAGNAAQRRLVQRRIHAGACIFEHGAVESSVAGLAHRCAHAHVGRDARNQEVPDPSVAQQELEIRVCKRSFAGLVHYRLALNWIEFRDDVVSLASPNEKSSSEGAERADALA